MNPKFTMQSNKNKVRGATIIEVIVSVFLLTFGILALIAAQIRSVASVQEAENRTLIAQAAEAYAEGMLANPTVVINDNRELIITYDHYRTDPKDVDANKTEFTQLGNNAQKTKKELADLQTDNFQAALNAIPDVAGIQFTVCQDVDDARKPAWGDGHCNKGATDGTVIKVAWRMKDKDGKTDTDAALHTYVLKVKS
ncbi:MAG: type IV pilus modification protein PilV [Alysiella sp.]|uniref:type IV pilus modification protein PilV n=1 Tax=Alysiella sp. TaxID=1872483 RepID=UPI0026DC1C96|nr:type IV pilus modification protein PilV [Alysiella sp.]MDO4433498.1 type IV pilus modification protein PilV [Alysiella sp.]